jgi:hypothetical protein
VKATFNRTPRRRTANRRPEWWRPASTDDRGQQAGDLRGGGQHQQEYIGREQYEEDLRGEGYPQQEHHGRGQ